MAKSVQLTLTRPQAQGLLLLLRDLQRETPSQLLTEVVAAAVDALTDQRPVIRWQSFRDTHGEGWSLLCDRTPFAQARRNPRGRYRCVLLAGPERSALGEFTTLREARTAALAEFLQRAG